MVYGDTLDMKYSKFIFVLKAYFENLQAGLNVYLKSFYFSGFHPWEFNKYNIPKMEDDGQI